MAENILLISNSTLHGSGYLDHCESQMREVLAGRKRVLFVPYARPGGRTNEAYTALARGRLERMGFKVEGIPDETRSMEAISAVERAEAIFIGGGNTFVLLDGLYQAKVIESIVNRVRAGVPYIGTSAGANVAGKTIGTTNDMPVVLPKSFDASGLIPFNINPHYIDNDPNLVDVAYDLKPTAGRNARELRILDFQDHNARDVAEHREGAIRIDVVALREGAMLHVTDGHVYLKGSTSARVFVHGQEPTEHQPGETLDFLLRRAA